MSHTLVSHTLPLDWENSTLCPRGVSRSSRLCGYLVSLLLNQKQFQFGPFRMSRLEASTAYDRLTRYFLPFVKSKPVPHCPSEVFFSYQDHETEELYGVERLRRLRAKLTLDAKQAGLDIEAEKEFRVNFIIGACSIKVERPGTAMQLRNERALNELAALSLRELKVPERIVEPLRRYAYSVPEDKHALDETLKAVLEAHNRFRVALDMLVSESKTILDLPPKKTE